jgi:hypothetical protein
MAKYHTFSIWQLQRLDASASQDPKVTPVNLIASIIRAFSPTLCGKFFADEEDAYVELVVRQPLSETRFERDGRRIMVKIPISLPECTYIRT